MIEQLVGLLRSLDRDRAVRTIVLTGAGRGFCSGGDVASITAASTNLGFDDRVERLRRWTESLVIITQSHKVVIAAINGPVAGMGLGLALACDLQIASVTAKFVPAFAKLGFSGDFGGLYFLSQRMGPSRARQVYMLAETLTAEEALAAGLVNWVVPEEEFADRVGTLARQIADSPPLALTYMKRNVALAQHASLAAYLDVEAVHQVRTSFSEDHLEARAAMAEKRKPEYRGR